MTYKVAVGESLVEWNDVSEELDLFIREGNLQRLDVGVKVLDLASADDGKHVRHLLHAPRDGDYTQSGQSPSIRITEGLTGRNALGTDLLRDLFQRLGDLALRLVALPVRVVHHSPGLAGLETLLFLRVRPQPPPGEHIPRRKRHA